MNFLISLSKLYCMLLIEGVLISLALDKVRVHSETEVSSQDCYMREAKQEVNPLAAREGCG